MLVVYSDTVIISIPLDVTFVIQRIMAGDENPSRMLQKLAIVMSTNETINDILMGQKSNNAPKPELKRMTPQTRSSVPSGAPAEILFVAEMIDERKGRLELAQLEEQEKKSATNSVQLKN